MQAWADGVSGLQCDAATWSDLTEYREMLCDGVSLGVQPCLDGQYGDAYSQKAWKRQVQGMRYSHLVAAVRCLDGDVHHTAASRKLLETAITLQQKMGAEFDMSLWSSAVQNTLTRTCRLQRLSVSQLQKTFQSVLHLVEEKKKKYRLEASHAVELHMLYGTAHDMFASQLTDHLSAPHGKADELRDALSKSYDAALEHYTAASKSTKAPAMIHGGRPLRESVLVKLVQFAVDLIGREPQKSTAAYTVINNRIDDLCRVAVESLLTAVIDYHSTEAKLLFCKMFELLDRSAAARKSFAALHVKINTFDVLPWVGQLISYLSSPVGEHIAPLLRRVATYFPQVVFYPFSAVYDDLRAATDDLPAAVKDVVKYLAELLSDWSMRPLSNFVAGLHQLQHPEQRFRGWQTEIHRAINAKKLNVAADLWRRCVADCLTPGAVGLGEYNRKFARDWSAKVLKECTKKGEFDIENPLLAVKRMHDLASKMQQGVDKKRTTAQVQSFSELLSGLRLPAESAAGIDLPIQPSDYLMRDRSKLLPRITSVHPALRVMTSVQMPKKLTVNTSDDATRAYLVKGGDDLRLDQRVEQVFQLVSSFMQRGNTTRHLRIRTYSVVPVSKRVGLIEWVDSTTPLKALIEGSMRRDPAFRGSTITIGTHPATQQYHKFISEVSAQSTRSSDPHRGYRASYELYPNTDSRHSNRVKAWLQTINPRYLSHGLAGLVSSSAAFYTIRRNFGSSLSPMSMASYIFGIGDRHLENILVDSTTGEVVEIDFGHAFGSATIQLPVPELIPFRMSPQMQYALGPLGADYCRPSMVKSMSVLRSNSSTVREVLSVFLREPLINWEAPEVEESNFDASTPRSNAGASGSGGQGSGSGEIRAASAAKKKLLANTAGAKLAIASRKLCGDNPADIMVEEAMLNSKVAADKKVAEGVRRAVLGDPVPSRAGRSCVSVDDHVDVLLSMAADSNLLGRTWIGWAPLF